MALIIMQKYKILFIFIIARAYHHLKLQISLVKQCSNDDEAYTRFHNNNAQLNELQYELDEIKHLIQ